MKFSIAVRRKKLASLISYAKSLESDVTDAPRTAFSTAENRREVRCPIVVRRMLRRLR